MNDRHYKRETLASRVGFIFLSAGCAIGLGNVWRFPYIVGQYGGAVFVLIYLAFLSLLAVPIMVMEFSVGRASGLSLVGQFKTLEPKGTKWHIWSYIAVAGNYVLMSFYTVVTGWMLAYFWSYLTGDVSSLSGAEAIGGYFSSLLGDPGRILMWMAIGVAFATAVCCIGLREGVERVSKITMSGLLIIMIVLALRSVSLPGASAGIDFYLSPDLSKIHEHGVAKVLYAALGQAFFTLSIGIGSMAIFGSYIGRDRALTGEAVTVAVLDTIVALCAGLIIFPSCFAYGVEPTAGPGLIFVTLPHMFEQMPSGRVWGALFFLFMSFAALSTLIAVFENIIANSIDTLGWGRKKATIFNFFVMLVISTPCALGFNVWSGFHPLGGETIILDLEDFIVSDNILPIGAVVYTLFCCSKSGWGWDKFIAEADAGSGMKFPKWSRVFVSWAIPSIMLVILIMGYIAKFA